MAKVCYTSINMGNERLELIQQCNTIIAEYQADGYTLTLRQLFYQMVSRDIIPNTMKSYKRLGDIVNDARMAGLMDWDAIEDRARDRKGHEATFPRELVIRCLRLVEFGRKGLKVLDPCCGTGTVPIVAVEQGHHGVGIDLSPEMASEAMVALGGAKLACEETPA